ncbi:PilZ domain-containing protein [Sphingobium yanoikuyae]|uniref:PilZ domain-containing protein n=1 Tax=Sphingobium yanoikuyae TaxID=13690 RepID=A0A9X7U4A5_SPHYA|nr:PilZ domain-containing protein [Sphingobium yanoikuyae]QNG43483.1 PilZ domain-containing protein [Sphingobium yanoikuyae]
MGFSRRLGSQDLRRHTRFATAFEAKLLDGDKCTDVVIGDISAGGALIQGAGLRSIGAKVRLRAAGLDIEARVIWNHDGLCGICFAHALDPLAIVRDNMPYFRAQRSERGDVSLPPLTVDHSPFVGA